MSLIDKKNKEDIKEIIRQGERTEFWALIVQALQESKEAIQREQDGEDIAELPADQYKLKNELYKAKKDYLETLMRTPQNIISWLQEPSNENKEFDPYSKP